MKMIETKTTVVFLVLFVLWSCQKEKDFSLNFKFDNIGEGKIYLEREISADSNVTDSIEIIDSQATYKGKSSTPELLWMRFNNDKRKFPIFVESGNITVTFSSELPNNYTVTGSLLHLRYDQFMELYQQFKQQENQLYDSYQKAKQENNQPLVEEISKQLDDLETQQLRFCQNYVDTTSDLVSLYVIRRYLIYTADYNTLKNYLNRFDKNVQKSGMFQMLTKR
ncbi:MAG TPA: DUF4369 domain-containing protein, partial [Salinivirgaceae bacterium]|nr:DUF4369 domain-containing protein [Salinivirgaceae bacterium]